MPPSSQKPRAPRHSVFLMATVERFGKFETTKHRVRNLSTTGVCVDHKGEFKVGATIVVTVGDLVAVGAQVRWVDGSLAGLQFAHEIEIAKALGNAVVPPRMSTVRNPLRPKV